MLSSIKGLLILLLLVFIIMNWQEVVNFLNGIADWLLYYMAEAAKGPTH